MSKKRKTAGSTTAGKSLGKQNVVAPSQIDVSRENPRQNRTRNIVIATIALVIFAAGIAAYVMRREKPAEQTTAVAVNQESPETLLRRLSESKFEGMESQVADKIRQLIAEVNKNPTSAYAWGKLGINLDVHDLKKDSLVCYRKAESLNADDFRWPYYHGVALATLGSHDAVQKLEKATQLKPGYAPAWVRLGQALSDAKKPDEASQKFQTAIQLEPSSHAYVGLARVYLSQERVEESIANLLEAVRLDPRHGEAHGLLSEAYRRMNRATEAQRELWISQQLPKRTPLPDQQMSDWANEGVSSYWYDLRGNTFLKNGQYEHAVKELTLAANATNDARIYDTLGIALQYLRRFDEAATWHQKALAIQPNSASMLNNLASVYFEQGNLPRTFEVMNRAIKAEPAFAYSYHHLGQIHLRLSNRKAAIEAYKLGVDRIPQNNQLATQLAWLLATSPEPSLRDGKEAVRLAESAIGRLPAQDPQSLVALAAAYAENRQFDRAVQAATTARQMLGTAPNELAKRIESHIALYQQQKPFHEKPN